MFSTETPPPLLVAVDISCTLNVLTEFFLPHLTKTAELLAEISSIRKIEY
jgi:hypothetical protein